MFSTCPFPSFIIANSTTVAQNNVFDFFATNTDPFSLIYYAVDYIGPSFADLATDKKIRTLLFALRFNDPTSPTQPDYNTTFASLLTGLNTTNSQVLTLPFASAADIAAPFYAYDLRRGFWGPQVPHDGVTKKYLNDLTQSMEQYTNNLIESGDDATSTSFVLQYQFPGLNGHLPVSADATAWPHAVAGHQTLFTPGWTDALNDGLAKQVNDDLNEMAWGLQQDSGVQLADYPNYMGPGVAGSRLYGLNLPRLAQLKQKYDPQCYLHQGRVPASDGCVQRGAAILQWAGSGAIRGLVGDS